MNRYEKTKLFLLGALVALLALQALQVDLAGAGSDENGRYQVSVSEKYAWVLDTTTGEVYVLGMIRDSNQLSRRSHGNPFTGSNVIE